MPIGLAWEPEGCDHRPAGLTCLKQKGMVSTLTPTMLFTMFVISPQLEAAAAAVIALTQGSPKSRDHPGVLALKRDGRLPGGGGLAGRRRVNQPADTPTGIATDSRHHRLARFTDRLRVSAPTTGRVA